MGGQQGGGGERTYKRTGLGWCCWAATGDLKWGEHRLTTLDKQDMAEDKTFKLSPQHVLWNRVVAAVMPRGLVTELGEVRDMVTVTKTFFDFYAIEGGLFLWCLPKFIQMLFNEQFWFHFLLMNKTTELFVELKTL